MLVVAGCVDTDEKIAMLAELESPSLVISLAGPSFSVELSYEQPADHCPVLGKQLTARVAGVDVPITDRGGVGLSMDSVYDCSPVHMWLWIRPETADAIFELSDPSLTIRCNLGDVLLPSAALVPLEALDCGGVPNRFLGA